MKTVLSALVVLLILVRAGFAAPADDACFHNVVRDALNTGKTMRELGPWMDQSYDFSRQNQPAQALPPLQESENLRNSAAAVAASCNFQHSGWNDVGENLFVGTEAPDKTYSEWLYDRNWTLENAVADWAYEARYLTIYSTTTYCEGGVSNCGHYTQIMWEDTTHVGCATQFCPNGVANFSSRESTLIVCHYSPQGNYVPYVGGQYLPPYQIGGYAQSSAAPLSGCDDGLESPPPVGGVDVENLLPILNLLLDN